MKRRCKYHCSVEEVEGSPSFTIRVDEQGFDDVVFREKTPKGNGTLFSQPLKEKCVSDVVRIGSIIIFHLSK